MVPQLTSGACTSCSISGGMKHSIKKLENRKPTSFQVHLSEHPPRLLTLHLHLEHLADALIQSDLQKSFVVYSEKKSSLVTNRLERRLFLSSDTARNKSLAIKKKVCQGL